ncbi:hypothetical protein BDC45DRAFT_569262 [Circinella umbellata]|nr:hypothetical protein BDC45DRAFT_569262 [Circinella umbellata]
MSTASPVTTEITIINTAIPSSFEKKLLVMLEHRAHALSMKSKFRVAEQAAEIVIQHAPTLPQGHLCFSKLLSMQGKHTRKVSKNTLAYGQLLQAKKKVDNKK